MKISAFFPNRTINTTSLRLGTSAGQAFSAVNKLHPSWRDTGLLLTLLIRKRGSLGVIHPVPLGLLALICPSFFLSLAAVADHLAWIRALEVGTNKGVRSFNYH